jgi:putative peptidoglycan lipid II flippase
LSDELRQSQRSLIRTIAGLAPASLMVQLLSFGSSIVLATLLGASTVTDAYYLALSVPGLVYGALLAAVQLGGIPVLTQAYARRREEFVTGSNELVSATLASATVLTIALTGIMILLLPAVAGGSGELQAQTRKFAVELAPYAVTGAMIGALGSVLGVRGRFIPTTLVLGIEPLLKSILVLLFHRQLGAQALVIGNVVGNLAAVVILWRIVLGDGIPLRLGPFRSSPVVRALFKLSAPLVVSQSVLQFNPVIDRAAAAALGAGSVTVLELGFRLFNAPTTILGGVIIAPLAAKWSALLAEEGWDAVVRSFSRVVVGVVIALPPLVVVGFLLRHEVVDVVYTSHAFTPSAASKTGDVVGMFLLGLIPQVVIIPLATLFVIRGETIFPMKVGIANFVINAVLDVIMRQPFGVAGIALSTTLTLTVLCAAYIRQAHRRWGSLGLGTAIGPLKASVASCLCIYAAGTFILSLASPQGNRVETLGIAVAMAVIALVIHAAIMIVTGTVARAGLSVAIPRLRSRTPIAQSAPLADQSLESPLPPS